MDILQLFICLSPLKMFAGSNLAAAGFVFIGWGLDGWGWVGLGLFFSDGLFDFTQVALRVGFL